MEHEFKVGKTPPEEGAKNQEQVLIDKAKAMFGEDLVTVRD